MDTKTTRRAILTAAAALPFAGVPRTAVAGPLDPQPGAFCPACEPDRVPSMPRRGPRHVGSRIPGFNRGERWGTDVFLDGVRLLNCFEAEAIGDGRPGWALVLPDMNERCSDCGSWAGALAGSGFLVNRPHEVVYGNVHVRQDERAAEAAAQNIADPTGTSSLHYREQTRWAVIIDVARA